MFVDGQQNQLGAAFLPLGGKMGPMVRAHDWSASALGPIADWPQSLKSVVGLVVASPLPMIVLWGPGLIQIYNDGYAIICGPKHPLALGQPTHECWPEVWAFNAPIYDAVMDGETRSFDDQLLVIDRHGHPEDAWFDLTYSPVRDDANLIAGVLVTVVETTDQMLADRRLDAQTERQRRLLEDAPGFVCISHGPEHIYDFVNDAYARLCGERHYIGRTVREVLPDIADQGFYELLDQVYATGERFLAKNTRLRLRRTPGGEVEQRFVDFIYQPMVDESGEVIGIFTQGHDVTEQHLAQAALRASEDRFRVFAQSMPIHVWSATPDGHVDWFNDQGYAYTGYGPGLLEGEAWMQTVHPDDLDRAKKAWFHSLATGERYEIQFRIMGADDAYRSFLIRADPVRAVDGRITLWVGTDTDVEVQNQQKDELGRLNVTLEEQVSERTRALVTAEAALRQSQKMEAMGQLTGGVAHDFNNLLTPIIGCLDMLTRRGLGNERERRLIDGALQSADRAKTLVQRLLAFARRQPLQAVAVDLSRLIDGMAGLIGSTVGPNIEVRVELADDLPLANADANQLEMAILNLGVNARDAMPGGGTLTITAVRESVLGEHRSGLKPGHYVRLSVADTGTGMDAATLARAIEPFFSTKGIGKGTGLGLSMVHGLVAQLGGALTLVSEPGLGTAVELWLPVSFGPIGHEHEIRAAPIPIAARGCALLVDDEELVRMSTADMLADLGYDVIEAASAEQALQLLDEGATPDIVITDHLMPGLSGGDLALKVRAQHPVVPILIVSGYAESEGIAPDLPRLTKPFRNAELAQSIARLMHPNS